jgi:hypothetical protein
MAFSCGVSSALSALRRKNYLSDLRYAELHQLAAVYRRR